MIDDKKESESDNIKITINSFNSGFYICLWIDQLANLYWL